MAHRSRAAWNDHPARQHDPEAWEAYLSTFPWSLYVTFTFVFDAVSLGTAFAHFTTAVRTVARERTREHVRVGFACGPQRHRVPLPPHFHALLGPAEPRAGPLLPDVLWGLWPHGNLDVRVYDPARGAVGYVARHPHVDHVIACPTSRCWRHGPRCPHGSSRWPDPPPCW